MTDVKTRQLLIHTQNEGELLIEIPDSYKVTFGKLQPGERGYDGNALRIYETKEKQRACFVNVVSFRDLSIPVKKRIKTVEEKGRSKRDSRGNAESKHTTVVRESEWEEA